MESPENDRFPDATLPSEPRFALSSDHRFKSHPTINVAKLVRLGEFRSSRCSFFG